jgi:hypothetical protein
MGERSDSILKNLLILVSGLALIFLAHTGVETTHATLARVLEVIGFALAGYAPIRLIISLRKVFSEGWRQRIVDNAFRRQVKVVAKKDELPRVIVAGAHCVTPPFGAELDLRKIQRLRAYLDFVQSEAGQGYPPLFIVTGRSQGYARMLAQALGMVDPPLELPFVIENGAALYFPVCKTTIQLVSGKQRQLIEEARGRLVEELPESEFEPKVYTISIRLASSELTADELLQRVSSILTEAKLCKSLSIGATASAIDITPAGVNKSTGFMAAIQEYSKITTGGWEPEDVESILTKTVGVAASSGDLCILRAVGKAYCSAYHVAPEICGYIVGRYNSKENIIELEHIDALVNVIERECGLRIT